MIIISIEILDDMWRASDDGGEGLMGGISQLTTGSKVKRNIRCILLLVFLERQGLIAQNPFCAIYYNRLLHKTVLCNYSLLHKTCFVQ